MRDKRFCYWMGVLYSDGFVYVHKTHGNKYIGLVSKDRDIVEKFCIFMREPLERVHPRNGYYRLDVADNRVGLFDVVAGYGVIPNKSNNWTVPVATMSVEETWAFLRGVMDGDGCITESLTRYKDKRYWNPAVSWLVNPLMAKYIAEFLKSQGVKVGQTQKRKNLIMVRVLHASKVVVLRTLYEQAPVEESLDRKRARAVRIIKKMQEAA